MLRWLTAGESHGPELLAILEGLPAGVRLSLDHVRADLARRKLGYGRGARMKFEQDELHLSAGVRHGLTIGSPIGLRIGNTEWPKWTEVMSPDPVDDAVFETGRGQRLTRPRPGHADLTGMQKYGFDEARPVLERASARETAARVALGAIAKRFLAELGIETVSHTIAIGEVEVPDDARVPTLADLEAIDADPVRILDPETSARAVELIDEIRKDGDTIGGSTEVVVTGLPSGIGSYAHWDRRLDAKVAAALMSIQAMKGVEIGDGFRTTRRRGSAAHDPLYATGDGIARSSDRAGGIEGGMTTGTRLRVRVGMKPIATVPHALHTVDVATGGDATAHHQRSDVCAVPASGVVAEAMVALTIADALLDKFGGDSVGETRRNLEAYVRSIPAHLRTTPELADPASARPAEAEVDESPMGDSLSEWRV
ncbi:chorismate synthase [Pseudoclavibacter endophyticus]|uniref:Chorismate synthase n=1 Tax=Pseudoclavibacter endophyticus TaxID=1778590 RepID=A0A6H9WGJ7_9MICO|nr:chorismate synthase [Pseudoclavibacter endophyticus]KAB1650079.1 chorismate synthase [Pseudoclavibacter endophyticus]GGA57456.1 chorismate synthase [Pseudoclavibacter endophyticus]